MGHHHHAPATLNRAFVIAIGLNLLYTFIEAGYAIVANSMSLLADAGHNLGDVLGLLLAWGANVLLSKPANERYSYGYKRTSILAALMNALLLVATSAIIGYESICKLLDPSFVHEEIVMIVASIGILINGGTALMFMRGSHDDLNIKGAFLHLAADALISIGVVIAAAIIFYTGWEPLDPLVGLMIVGIILFGTWSLLRDSVILMLDAVPHSISHREVKAYLASIEGVTAVHDLHIWGLSTKEIALTAHLVMPNKRLTDEQAACINQQLLRTYKINHVTLQTEQGSSQHPCLVSEQCR